MTSNTEYAEACADGEVSVPSETELHRLEHASSRTDRAMSWLGWHLPELGGVSAPVVAAWAFSPWCGLASAVAGAGWALNAARQRRHHRAGADQRQLPDGESHDGNHGHDDSGETGGNAADEQEVSA